ncbi:hypothetical protein E2C01_054809 [Portunus trituberculatus]|uniref:Uncharacterized protein n=1 Tax=Portunus trituberculatus TaxID=210409 RepID=A0A5B7GT14_PORTR|nr:hypothetical protein [Portunus trituberculatus]
MCVWRLSLPSGSKIYRPLARPPEWSGRPRHGNLGGLGSLALRLAFDPFCQLLPVSRSLLAIRGGYKDALCRLVTLATVIAAGLVLSGPCFHTVSLTATLTLWAVPPRVALLPTREAVTSKLSRGG